MSDHDETLTLGVQALDALLVDLAHLRAERDRYRTALVRIADNESGVWGHWARDALYPPEPKPTPKESDA